MTLKTIDIDALQRTKVKQKPYPYLIVPGFVKKSALNGIEKDYPKITKPGSFPLSTLKYGKVFAQFMADIVSAEMTDVMGAKFKMDLSRRPTMVTVRGQCRKTDGKIHTDSVTKLITVLIYMNGGWEAKGGRLKLLNAPDDLNSAFDEVAPEEGTLLAFRNQPNAWHGHESFEGQRRVIQLNWVRDRGVVFREQLRHKISAFFKRVRY